MAGAIKTFSKSLIQTQNPLITVFGTKVPNFLTLWMMKTKKNYVIKSNMYEVHTCEGRQPQHRFPLCPHEGSP